jgi:hypothetical protein
VCVCACACACVCMCMCVRLRLTCLLSVTKLIIINTIKYYQVIKHVATKLRSIFAEHMAVRAENRRRGLMFTPSKVFGQSGHKQMCPNCRSKKKKLRR